MRALFACAAEYGHFHPMVPVARALVDAGHDVAFALPASFCPRPQAAGFATLPVGMDRRSIAAQIARRFPEWSTVPVEQRLRFAMTNIGAGIVAPPMVDELVAAIDSWGADLLVHGPTLLAAPLAAEIAGIPSANHGWGPLVALSELQVAADAVAPLWEERSIPIPPLAGMFRYLYLDLCPPTLRAPDAEAIGVAHPLQPVPADPVGEEDLHTWVGELPAAPTVYVTLGTFCNSYTHLFSAILQGVRDEPVNVVVTVGYDQDPAALGPQPGNVHVVRYIPLSSLLPHCQLVVSHGGSGTVLAALGHGLPLLLVPQGHDQMQNAERARAADVGRSIAPGQLTPESVRAGVRQLLGDPAHTAAARTIRDEIRSMPGPAEAARLLERLAADRRPLVLPNGGRNGC